MAGAVELCAYLVGLGRNVEKEGTGCIHVELMLKVESHLEVGTHHVGGRLPRPRQASSHLDFPAAVFIKTIMSAKTIAH